MTHSIHDDVKNSTIIFCIDEYVRKEEHRKILKEWWFKDGVTLENLAADHNLSVTTIKDIIYRKGDPVLLRAMDMDGIPS